MEWHHTARPIPTQPPTYPSILARSRSPDRSVIRMRTESAPSSRQAGSLQTASRVSIEQIHCVSWAAGGVRSRSKKQAQHELSHLLRNSTQRAPATAVSMKPSEEAPKEIASQSFAPALSMRGPARRNSSLPSFCNWPIATCTGAHQANRQPAEKQPHVPERMVPRRVRAPNSVSRRPYNTLLPCKRLQRYGSIGA